MPILTCRLSPELDAKFTALAASYGGKSQLVRRLVEQVTGTRGPPPGPVKPGHDSASSKELRLRLTLAEHEDVREQADEAGLRPIQWAEMVLRARLGPSRKFSAPQAQALRDVRHELAAIGRNLNQIARAMNVAVEGGRVTELQLMQVEDLARDLKAAKRGIGEAMSGMLAYWQGADLDG